MVNQSTRAHLSAGRPLNGGIVLTQASFVLIRAVGPGLRQFGVSTAALDPSLSLADKTRNSVVVDTNNDWTQSAASRWTQTVAVLVGAFPLPEGSKDAAMIAYLRPGAHVATASVAADDSGEVLLETYIIHSF